ncbi:MAG TPA: helix-turn-helix transcriptional regulator [Steroidobacteraceae bacterium]
MKNILPELRARRGWTQGELATQLAVSRQTINAVETGRYEPSLSLAFAIAKLFALPIEKIFQGYPSTPRFARASGDANPR